MARLREPTDQPLRHRKARDRSLILPVAGVILFLPPFAQAFDIDAQIGGVPVPLLYIFGVWAVLILGAARIARRLANGEAEHGSESAADEPPANAPRPPSSLPSDLPPGSAG